MKTAFAAAVIALAAQVCPVSPAADPIFPITSTADSAQSLRAWRKGAQPKFTLADATGKQHAITDYGGRPVLVHFFATWCEPCRPELRSLDRLAVRDGDNAVRVVAISVNEPDGRVRRFFEHESVSFPVLLDRDRAVAKSWGVEVLPTTYLLDANLMPRLFVEHDLAWDALDLAPILGALSTARREQSSQLQQQHSIPVRQGGGTHDH